MQSLRAANAFSSVACSSSSGRRRCVVARAEAVELPSNFKKVRLCCGQSKRGKRCVIVALWCVLRVPAAHRQAARLASLPGTSLIDSQSRL